MAKTLKALSKFYWWPDVWKFVQEYVRGCAMSPPLRSVEVDGPVIVRKQQGNNVKPNPEYEGCDEL